MSVTDNLKYYISESLGTNVNSIIEVREIRNLFGRETIDCTYRIDRCTQQRIIKFYHQGFEDTSEIGVTGVTRKVQLAGLEFPEFAINTPRIFGSFLSDSVSCVIMEKLDHVERDTEVRIEAATILARLHNLSPDFLSTDLQRLIRESKPNQDRGRSGLLNLSNILDNEYPQWRVDNPELSENMLTLIGDTEPVSGMSTLVHGDYFPENLFPTPHGLSIIDWDTLAMGDPMWDLGMLIGTDDGISETEIIKVLREYQRNRPIENTALNWHIDIWRNTVSMAKIIQKSRSLHEKHQ